ncbi:MAG: bifunctional phosphopantothenoylcysteine decarboxylase/phosphopantothenate--cysteine ligase CoaBC [Aerococcus sp.]|nr:bifunctional phosphopantothenoylcysteine decarboxylase/phosphopantothenate--cysteine ligase CoaBC [Aerococcus sp.]
MLENKHILLMVTGGIAAYKIPLLVRLLIKRGAQVRVAMTPDAEQFVTPQTLEVLTHHEVLRDATVDETMSSVPHIDFADWADIVVVAPATANTIGKLANGIADHQALSTWLAVSTPTIIVPAMNGHMWQNASVQRSIAQLREDGHHIISPDYGFLAEGYDGRGRMVSPEALAYVIEAYAAIQSLEATVSLRDLSVAISMGGTEEAIDPVRFITNRSSGKMGLAIAITALLLGAREVHAVVTPVAQQLPTLPDIHYHPVGDARELAETMTEMNRSADVIVMAAAVSDYRPAVHATQKIKKKHGQNEVMNLELVENPDILKSLDRQQSFLVGFAAETDHVLDYAREKLQKKDVDMIIANDVSDHSVGFGSDQNAVTIVSESDMTTIAKQSKFNIAAAIWQHVYREIT